MRNPLPRARGTLAAAVLFCTLTIWGVHYQQEQERESMYQGVLKDDERRREKMQQRQADFDESKRKREIYEKVQTIDKSSAS
ncbi:hypothetical protein AAF712_013609 [Marasmius tenuissimus]|uniref:Uncharacterized protein n=1 Tax=Marasmius tenuissimus TaxID=585030 RepID=A0ABR2ZEK0_9AGAR|nr:hypothetical protein PM082_005813 [Marasmius tenuissimus]